MCRATSSVRTAAATVGLLAILRTPHTLFADVITPLTTAMLPLFPLIVVVETLILYLWLTKRLRIPVSILRSVLAVLTANIATSLIGTCIPMYRYVVANLVWLGVAFVLSVLVEWAVYIAFFLRTNIRRRDLFVISLLANLASYGILVGIAVIGAAR